MNTDKRQKLFTAITIIISIVSSILLTEYLLGWYRQSIDSSTEQDPGLIRYHPQLGWNLTPNWLGTHKHHDFETSYQINAKGFRSNGDSDSLDIGRKIAIIGDSFTFGFGVKDNETFTAQLSKADPDNVYINMGVPGYSTDQQFLLMGQQSLLQGKTQTINHYVLMFYLGNDILDNMLPHSLQAEPAKPYFVENNGNLKLKNIPVPQVRKPAELRAKTLNNIIFGEELNQYYSLFDYVISKSEILSWLIPRSANTNPETINDILGRRLADHKKLLFTLFKAMKQEANRQDADFSIAILPGSSYVNTSDSYSFYFQDHVRQTVITMAQKLGIKSIDVASELRTKKRNDLYFPHEGHFTPNGHTVVSEILQKALTD